MKFRGAQVLSNRAVIKALFPGSDANLSVMRLSWALCFIAPLAWPATVPLDIDTLRPGPVTVTPSPSAVTVTWRDADSHPWRADFSLDPAQPLITSIAVDGKPVIERGRPVYRCATGTRHGGWDAFFDHPPDHPEGTRRFEGVFNMRSAQARSIGDRVELTFDGLRMGLFEGAVRYTIFPGSRLIQQEAVVKTAEPDITYYYDAGLTIAANAYQHGGWMMESEATYYDTDGQLRTVRAAGPQRNPVRVRHRTIALRTRFGSIATFPPPHQYFFARPFTTNLGYVWHRGFRGDAALGIRQLPDDNTPFYAWMNAPPGTEQRMGVFFLLSSQPPERALADVLRYTHNDKFPAVDGYKAMTYHWHFALTEQAMEHGLDWTPPFKPILKAMGIDAAILMDFQNDGHENDLGQARLKELDTYYKACRAQSDPRFLLIPAEEGKVHLGGHWGVIFPKPVYWYVDRPAGAEFRASDPKYGTVYHVGSAQEALEMVRRENGYVYEAHPRTKDSTGYPDKIKDSEQLRDPHYLGAGWRAMPSDLSSPRLAERAFKAIDDMNNWGLHKRMLAEEDIFQPDTTSELYGYVNVNYVRMPELPDFDHYQSLLDVVARGDYFMSTGEIALPKVSIAPESGDDIRVAAEMSYTFPLRLAEVVWGDGSEIHRRIFPLDTTREFGHGSNSWTVQAKGWKWARFAVWDVAGNGAFVNPVWR